MGLMELSGMDENPQEGSLKNRRNYDYEDYEISKTTDEEIEFILGLIAGEGSFGVRWKKSPRVARGFSPSGRFSMSLHDDDAETLNRLKEKFGFGTVKDSTNDIHIYNVISTLQCLAIAERIDNHLKQTNSLFEKTEKYKSYLLWKEALQMMRNYEHYTEDGAKRLAQKKVSINKSSRGKTVEELIEMTNFGDY